MLARLDDHFRVQETALKLRAQRQEVLASNIANADTPHYKARDFDFSAAFDSAMQARKTGGLNTTHARHLQASSSLDPLSQQLMYRKEYQSAVDGNTVNMDTEMREFTDNAVRYQAAVTFMQKRIEGLRGAIQGQ